MHSSEVENLSAIIVIVLSEVLVARDIEMIVRSARPGAQIVLVQTVNEAVNALPPGRIEVAFVQADAAMIAASALGRRIAADGGCVVVLYEEVEEGSPEGWKALPFPFASEHVVSVLAGLSRSDRQRSSAIDARLDTGTKGVTTSLVSTRLTAGGAASASMCLWPTP